MSLSGLKQQIQSYAGGWRERGDGRGIRKASVPTSTNPRSRTFLTSSTTPVSFCILHISQNNSIISMAFPIFFTFHPWFKAKLHLLIIFIKYYDKYGDERTHDLCSNETHKGTHLIQEKITTLSWEHKHIILEVQRKGQLSLQLWRGDLWDFSHTLSFL